MEEILEALREIEMQSILLWPNIDAGSDHVDKSDPGVPRSREA